MEAKYLPGEEDEELELYSEDGTEIDLEVKNGGDTAPLIDSSRQSPAAGILLLAQLKKA